MAEAPKVIEFPVPGPQGPAMDGPGIIAALGYTPADAATVTADLVGLKDIPYSTSAAFINNKLAQGGRWRLPKFRADAPIDGPLQIPATIEALETPPGAVLTWNVNGQGLITDALTGVATNAAIRLAGTDAARCTGAVIRIRGISFESTAAWAFFSAGTQDCDIDIRGPNCGAGIQITDDVDSCVTGRPERYAKNAFLFVDCLRTQLDRAVVPTASTTGNHSVMFWRCQDTRDADCRSLDNALIGWEINLCDGHRSRGLVSITSAHEACNLTNSNNCDIGDFYFLGLAASYDYLNSLYGFDGYNKDTLNVRPPSCRNNIIHDGVMEGGNTTAWASVMSGIAASPINVFPAVDSGNQLLRVTFVDCVQFRNARPELDGRPEFRCVAQLNVDDVARDNIVICNDPRADPIYFAAVLSYNANGWETNCQVSGTRALRVGPSYLGDLMARNDRNVVIDSWAETASRLRPRPGDPGGGTRIRAARKSDVDASSMTAVALPAVTGVTQGDWVSAFFMADRRRVMAVSGRTGTSNQFALSDDGGSTWTLLATPSKNINGVDTALIQQWQDGAWCPSLGCALFTARTTVPNSGFTYLAAYRDGMAQPWTPVAIGANEPLGAVVEIPERNRAYIGPGYVAGGNWGYLYSASGQLTRVTTPLTGVKRIAYVALPGLPMTRDNEHRQHRVVLRGPLTAANTIAVKCNGVAVGPVAWAGTSDATLEALAALLRRNPNVARAAVTNVANGTENDRVLTVNPVAGGRAFLSDGVISGDSAPVIVVDGQDQYNTVWRDPWPASAGMMPNQTPDLFVTFDKAFVSGDTISVQLGNADAGIWTSTPLGFGGALLWNTAMVVNQAFSVTIAGPTQTTTIGPVAFSVDQDTTLTAICSAIAVHPDVLSATQVAISGDDIRVHILARAGRSLTLSAAAVTNVAGNAALPTVTVTNIGSSDNLIAALAALINGENSRSVAALASPGNAGGDTANDRMLCIRPDENTVITTFEVIITGANPPAAYKQPPAVIAFPQPLSAGLSFSCKVDGVTIGPIVFQTNWDVTFAAIRDAVKLRPNIATAFLQGRQGDNNDLALVIVPAAGKTIAVTDAKVTGIAARPLVTVQYGAPPKRQYPRTCGIMVAIVQGVRPKLVLTFSADLPGNGTFDARLNEVALAQVVNADLASIAARFAGQAVIASAVADTAARTITLTASAGSNIAVDQVALSGGVTCAVTTQAMNNAEISYDGGRTWRAINIGCNDNLTDITATEDGFIAVSKSETLPSGARYPSDSGNRVHRSHDGLHWEHMAGPGDGAWSRVQYFPEFGFARVSKTGGTEAADATAAGAFRDWAPVETVAGVTHTINKWWQDPFSGLVGAIGQAGACLRSVSVRPAGVRAVVTL